MRVARSRSSVPPSAATNARNVCLPIWITTYDAANSRACSPNACGIATDISRLMSINAKRSKRTGTVSVSSSFVVHVV
jgi:hypothetical protein